MITCRVLLSSKRPLQGAFSLTHFIPRQKALGLYRQFLRLIRQIEDGKQKQDMRDWIRSEFNSRKGTTDKELIEMHLANGLNALRDLENSLRHAHALKH